ncbi:hypothetical protein C2E31_17530 [Rhodopirellula baltica]|nr:hypothetical protein C2E31_17530 [Rhodopirellula baltica]
MLDDEQLVLLADTREANVDFTFVEQELSNSVEVPIRQRPLDRTARECIDGIAIHGRYQVDSPSTVDWTLDDTVGRNQILALTSYLVGMEIPGLHSLFTQLSIEFGLVDQADVSGKLVDQASSISYSFETTRFDPALRMLDSELRVVATETTPAAKASIRTYFRLPSGPTSPENVKRLLLKSGTLDSLRDQVFLVSGGSRGLGADFVSTLALAGATVYATGRSFPDETRQTISELQELGATVHLLIGDVGNQAWCDEIATRIKADEGRLNGLVLNACAPPQVVTLGDDLDGTHFSSYINDNLNLVRRPLLACRQLLCDSNGRAIAISSSFVEENPPAFASYVALKTATESLLTVFTKENDKVAGIVVRPPRLQTAWNDTPMAIAGARPTIDIVIELAQRLATPQDPGTTELISQFKKQRSLEFEKKRSEDEGLNAQIDLSIVATFTAEPIRQALDFWFDMLGIRGEIKFEPYAQVLQSLLNPGSLTNTTSGTAVVMIRISDWLREQGDSLADETEQFQFLSSMAEETIAALEQHRSISSGKTLLLLCPSAGNGPWKTIEEQLKAAATGLTGVAVVEASDFHDVYAVREIDDPLRNKIGHIPYLPSYFSFLATVISRRLYRLYSPGRKLVASDCDNTLWEGVVGEEGTDGIRIHAQHQRLQKYLSNLSEHGILVALCSKNEEADVWPVFEERSDMLLQRESIVGAQINWLPKSGNLYELAERLNLGVDSFVFLDDNPVECGEVRSHCPSVLTLRYPVEPNAATRIVDHLWDLDVLSITSADRSRTEQYRQEADRQALRQSSGSFASFLDSLELDIDFRELNAEDVARASQLTLRTNQFNLTTVRRDETEMRRLLEDSRYTVNSVRVRDRFGDYGFVGLLIVDFAADQPLLDSFMLSCRVMGRGVEHRMMAKVAEIANTHSANEIRVQAFVTERNSPARTFVSSLSPDIVASTNGDIDVVFKTDDLQDCKFEPQQATDQQLSKQQATDSKVDTSIPTTDSYAQLRWRETFLERIVTELHQIDAIHAAVLGEENVAATNAIEVTDTETIEPQVVQAFADALRISPDEVRRHDRLENLGCDSFKVVEITVSLSALYPWLPSTLLFEHSSVSEIVAAITDFATTANDHDSDRTRTSVRITGTRNRDLANTDLAIVGYSVKTAGANSPEELWELISQGRSSVTPVPRQRPGFLGPLKDNRRHWAGLLDSVDGFDAEFFGIAPHEAALIDPQMRLFMQTAWHALEDAGDAGDRRDPTTGVFVGVMYSDYRNFANQTLAASELPYRCWESFAFANRLSQFLGVNGPSVAVDTACSSSGAAIHYASQSLLGGDCDTAIVGGLNLILDPARFVQLGRLGILSPNGQCRTFGSEANGTVLGEGVGVVVIRRLNDALERGDRIHAVIRGVGISNGAGTVGFTAPNPQAQADAIRNCLAKSGVDPSEISYVETHGTGTQLGDPIEVRGLALAYTDRQFASQPSDKRTICRIGSIKPNIGHLEAGACIVGLIKVLLQLKHRQLAPSLTSAAPNPKIDFAREPFAVQTELTPWLAPDSSSDGLLRAGVNSFGVGGTNVHLIIEEPPRQLIDAPHDVELPRDPVILNGEPVQPLQQWIVPVSAPTQSGLHSAARSLAEQLRKHPTLPLSAVAESLRLGRQHFAYRAAILPCNVGEAIECLTALANSDEHPHVIVGDQPASKVDRFGFLYTGQGSQFAGMGRELYTSFDVFRNSIDECNRIFVSEFELDIHELLFERTTGNDRIHQTQFTQPALFCIQYALANLWQSWGVRPTFVLGHSIGEFAAMVTAGVLNLEDAAKLVEARGRLMQQLPSGGVMCSVKAERSRVEPLVKQTEGISIAAFNGPESIVISGDESRVLELVKTLENDGCKATMLQVSHAFHSHRMDPILEDFEQVASHANLQSPVIPWISTVTGSDIEVVSPAYFREQIRKPVAFHGAMQCADTSHPDAYIEIGPRPYSLSMGRRCVPESSAAWLPSINQNVSEVTSILKSLAECFVRGGKLPNVWHHQGNAPSTNRVPTISLPGYPFDEQKHWFETPPRSDEALPSVAAAEEFQNLLYQETLQELTANPDSDKKALLVLNAADLKFSADVSFPFHHIVNENEWSDPAGMLNRLVADQDQEFASLVVVIPRCESETKENWIAECLLSLSKIFEAAHKNQNTSHLPIWVVTRGAHSVAADDCVCPEMRAVWGFCRSIALERPSQWGGILDLSSSCTSIPVESVGELLSQHGNEDQLIRRGTQTFVPRLVPGLPDTNSERAADIRCDRSYLVTGGLGALGLHATEWLIASGAKAIVLVSRSSPNETNRERLDLWRQQGIALVHVPCDVTDTSQLRTAIEKAGTLAPLGGVIHTAGIDQVCPIESLDRDNVARSLAAKVSGAWSLHRITESMPIDFMIFYSSISANWGSAERTVYAAANACLDALADARVRSGLPALSINWGPWAGGGMASDESLDALAAIGNDPVSPGPAMAALEWVLTRGAKQVTIANVRWDIFKPVLEARRQRPYLAELGRSGPSGNSSSSGNGDGEDWLHSIVGLDREQRLAAIVERIATNVATVLGQSSPDRIPKEKSLFQIGLDSLSALMLLKRLNGAFPTEFTFADLNLPGIHSIAASVIERLPSEANDSDPAPVVRVSTAATGNVIQVGDANREEIAAFHKAGWPHRPESLNEVRFRWMVEQSAERLGATPSAWFYRINDQIVGQNLAISVRCKIGERDFTTGWHVDTRVLEAFQTLGIGPELMQQAERQLPFSLSLGQTQQMRDILVALGWDIVCPLNQFVYIVDPKQVFNEKLPIGMLAGPASTIWRGIDKTKRVVRSSPVPASYQTIPIDRFGEQHDLLWEQMSQNVGCGTVRDASFMNWKYVDQPGQNFHCIEVRQNGRSVATATATIREPDHAYPYRRAMLGDLIANLDDRVAIAAAIEGIVTSVRRQGAAILIANITHPIIERALLAYGFIRRQPERFLVIRREGLDPASAETAIKKDNWLLSLADSDIDRPN